VARTKLTPQLSKDFCQALHDGLTFNGACDLVGIHRDTFYGWMERAEKGDGKPWSDFSDAVKEARAVRDRRYVKVIEKAAEDGTWQAAAWFLERTNRREFGRNESVEITGKDGGPVQQQVVGDDQRAKVTEMLDELATKRARKDAA
jgi:hypothetical protein